ncbi:Jacalin domain-containing protein [Rhizoctonia solani AG-1 IA]|uniref:Jacalin domain-containing protein n=1 Tax=Thanatephorus cucumeris (strain AG1-IA) TaxID=983506 RepID=L8WY80_THACA|nr:Jacalin domain-containing protein [Rhizoctonia solani AG-1 IA]
MEGNQNRSRHHGQPRGHRRSSWGSWAQVPHQNENNNVYPSDWVEGSTDASSYAELDEATRETLYDPLTLLLDLSGVRVDSNDGPRPSSHRVAQCISTRSPHVRETNNIDSDVVSTENRRETNYVHKGWSLSALSTSDKSPWAVSRIARNNQANSWIRSSTKYVLIQKLRVDLSAEDLSPTVELSKAFEEALKRPSLFERGDVIPLVFDIGISLAVTDLEPVARNYLKVTDRSYLGLHQLSMSASARASTQGGDPTTLQSEDNVKEWLRRPVTHLTTILSKELQFRLNELHRSLVTYCPVTTKAITSDGTSFDGTSHVHNTISKIAFYSDGYYIKSISVKYTTEGSPVTYGSNKTPNNEVTLTAGEYVTDIILWKDQKGVCGLQLNTSKGITSQHFGSDGGTPTVMRSSGGCLSAFSGIVQSDIIHDLRTLWRHDVQGSGLGGDREFSKYYGGVAGTPFSDWPFVKQSDTARIKSIRIKCGTYIDGIEVTYEYFGPGGRDTKSQKADYHGGSNSGGKEHTFVLASDEDIVAVLGRRTSDIFGGGDGEDFRCQAPATGDGKATRLHYICGKRLMRPVIIYIIFSPINIARSASMSGYLGDKLATRLKLRSPPPHYSSDARAPILARRTCPFDK